MNDVTFSFQSSRYEADERSVDVGINCNMDASNERELLAPITCQHDIPPKVTPFLFDEKKSLLERTAMIHEDDVKVRYFESGSKYVGEWNNHNMDGMCVYEFPNGAVFEGTLYLGVFDGLCFIHYPNGGVFSGVWFAGMLERWKYMFSDGLTYCSEENWTYLKKPDRRFWTEIRRGLKPGGAEQIRNMEHARLIPEGLYDTGYGFYNPKDLSVIHPVTGEFIKVPSAMDIAWILKNCPKGGETNVGFQKHLYRDWFGSDDDKEDEVYISDFCGINCLKLPLEKPKSRFRKLYARNKIDAAHGNKYRFDIFQEENAVRRDVYTMAKEKVNAVETAEDLVIMSQKWNKFINGEVLSSHFEYPKDERPPVDDHLIPIEMSSCHVTEEELIEDNHNYFLDPNASYMAKKSPKRRDKNSF